MQKTIEIVFNTDKEIAFKYLKKINLCIIDLDNCLIYGNSRIYLLIYILQYFLIEIRNFSINVCFILTGSQGYFL